MKFFLISPFIAAALVMLVFVRPCRLSRRATAIWAGVLLFAASKFLCFQTFGGHAFTPQFCDLVVWGWNLFYSSMMILLFLSLVLFFLPRRLKLYALPTLAVVMAIYGIWNGLRLPEVRKITLHFPNLPAALEGYRLVQISDLHVSPSVRRWRTEAVVRQVNALNGDLIVFTGDIVDGDTRHQLSDVEPLRRLAAPDGVWFVTGNHERYVNFSEWRPWYDHWGVHFLEDAAVCPHDGLWLVGADEPKKGMYYRRNQWPDVAPLFSAATNGALRVLLQHRPEWARRNGEAAHVDLQLSGHTHGGIFPMLAQVVQRLNAGFVRGLYALESGGYLYVSPGTGGWLGFPIRFFNPSEITVFTFFSHKR